MALFNPRNLGARVAGLRRERVQASTRFKDGKFHNTAPLRSTLVAGQTLGQRFGHHLGVRARRPAARA